MADQIFRREWDYLMNVFGEPALGWFYPDYRDAVRNTYGEIIGGTVYLVRQCPMRGLVLEDPLTFRNLEDGSGEVQFIGLKQAVTFKCSASDLIKGGVLNADGSYEVSDNPATTVIEGVLNHKYIMYRGQLYEVVNFDRGVIFRGDPSNVYITCTRDVDYVALNGKAQLVIQTTPDTPPVETFSVTVDDQLWGMYAPGTQVVLTTPTKEGYTFKGWSSQEVNVVNNTFTMPSQTVVINSLWEEVQNPDPGTYAVYVDSTFFGSYAPGSVVTLTEPTKPGFTFDGWESEDVTFSGNSFTMPESDVYITSAWTAIPAPSGSYKITVVNPCDSADATQAGEYEIEPYQLEDGSWSEPSMVLKAGSYYAMHTFSHWTVTSGQATLSTPNSTTTIITAISKNVTVECVWEEVADPRHTVTFVGIDRAPEKYNTGASVSCYAGLKEGYEFKRWSAVPSVSFSPRATSSNVTFTMPDSDVTVTATWAEVEYTVTFMVGTEVFATITTPPNTAIDVSEPTKEGYTFDGWYTSGGNEFNPADGVTNDLTVTAKFTGVPRTITFDSDGGSAVESITVENGKVIGQLPTPTKEGYDFIKWVDNAGNEVYATTVVTGDMLLTAVWEEVSEAPSEVDLIDTETTFTVMYRNVRGRFQNGVLQNLVSSGYSPYAATTLHPLKAGVRSLPPLEYTTTFDTNQWPTLLAGAGTPLEDRGQQTQVNLYGRVSKAGEDELHATTAGQLGLPNGYVSGGSYFVTMPVTTPNKDQTSNLPTNSNDIALRLVCTNVVKISDEWYRFEFAFINKVTNSLLLDRFSDWNTTPHDPDYEADWA